MMLTNLFHYLPIAWYGLMIHLILAAGSVSVIISYITSLMPSAQYDKIFRLAGIALLLLGIYLEGSYSTEKMWRDKTQQLENELKIAKTKSDSVRDVIDTKVITQIKYIKSKARDNVKIIKENSKEINSGCNLSDMAIRVHNNAASDARSASINADSDAKSESNTGE